MKKTNNKGSLNPYIDLMLIDAAFFCLFIVTAIVLKKINNHDFPPTLMTGPVIVSAIMAYHRYLMISNITINKKNAAAAIDLIASIILTKGRNTFKYLNVNTSQFINRLCSLYQSIITR